jgi:hypothetical protein
MQAYLMELKDYIPLLSLIAASSFALLTTLITQKFTESRETRTLDRQAAKEAYEEIKDIYAKRYSLMEKLIRLVRAGDNPREVERELSENNALLLLLAPQDVIEQSLSVSDLLHEWSVEFSMGEPRRIGEGMLVVSSNDSKHTQKAQEIEPKMMEAMVLNTAQMRKHLQQLRGVTGRELNTNAKPAPVNRQGESK